MTLLELLVAVAVALVISVGAVSLLRAQVLAARTATGHLDVEDTSRSVIELMTREIRMAGYNPRCLNPSPVTAVVVAEPQRLRIQYDRDASGTLDAGAAASEDIEYEYDNVTHTLRRRVGTEVDTLVTGVPPTGFALRYYALDGTEITGVGGGAALNPGQRAVVQEVTIRLEPESITDFRTRNNARSPLWTGVTLRNREHRCQ